MFFFSTSVPDHFKHLTAFYVNILCFIAQYIKIHDTYRFLLFVFFLSLDFLPTIHPLLKQNSDVHKDTRFVKVNEPHALLSIMLGYLKIKIFTMATIFFY